MCSFREFSLDLQNHDIAVIFSNKHFTCVYKAQIVAFVCGSSGILSRVNTLNTYLYPTVEFNKMHTPKLLENKYLTLKNESCVTRFKFFNTFSKLQIKCYGYIDWIILTSFFSSCLYSSEFKYISSNKKPDVEDIKKKDIHLSTYVSSKIQKKNQIILYKRWSLASCLNYIRKHFPVFFYKLEYLHLNVNKVLCNSITIQKKHKHKMICDNRH